MSTKKAKAQLIESAEEFEALYGIRLIAKEREKLRETKALLKQSERLNSELSATVSIYEKLSVSNLAPIRYKSKRKPKSKPQMIYTVALSDWHMTETVLPEEMLFDPSTGVPVNVMNPEIGLERAHRFFQLVVSSYKEQSASHDIKTLILWIGGDLIVNDSMHGLDSARSTGMSPLEEIEYCYGVLRDGIKYIRDNIDVECILIPTSFGNHGRTTDRPMFTSASRYSYEQHMYRMLSSALGDEDGIQFDVSDSIMKICEVDGFRLLPTHGDGPSGLRFHGGVGGLSVPYRKALARWNANASSGGGIHAAVVGHFHQATYVAGVPFGFVNGSLVGPSAYSLRMAHERPQQVSWLTCMETYDVARILPLWLD